MLHSPARSGKVQGLSGALNMAEMAGANRGWPASANSPTGACADSLAARKVSVNSADDKALSMAYPPSLPSADSMRIRPTRLAK
ncbi:hypothetical protein D3C72_1954870 [compost metagenome]